MYVGRLQQSPSAFHKSQGVPFVATKMLGSIAPPCAVGQMKAELESSTKGPAGLVLVAREMHMAVFAPCVVCTHPGSVALKTQFRGWVAGVE